MTNRLLFAAARGARIQGYGIEDRRWFITWFVPVDDKPPNLDRRIHPADEHLQYGPISTALRERVLHDNPWAFGLAEAVLYIRSRWPDWYINYNAIDYETTLLILAEALADEGL